MRNIVGLLIVLAACGGKTATTPSNHGGNEPGPVYGAVFEDGKTWSFALTHKTTPPPDMGELPSSNPAGTMTCKVVKTHAMGDVKMAKIECANDAGVDGESAGDGYGPAGYWVSTAAGLWHFDGSLSMAEIHEKSEALDPNTMLLAATPAAHSNETGDPDGGEPLEVFFAKANGDGWCVGYTFAQGDEAGWEMCFAKGAIASGHWFSAGATVIETSYVAK
jgi:hypothetical protein